MDGEKKSDWPEAIGAVAVICLLTSLALIAAGGWEWFCKLLDSSAPAWVQAVGSVGAIIATGWSVQRSHRLQREHKTQDAEDEYTRMLDVAYHLVARVRVIAVKIQGFEEAGYNAANRRAMHAELSAWLDGFRRFDVHRLQVYPYVEAVLAAESFARLLLSIMEVGFRDRVMHYATELHDQAALTAHDLDPKIRLLYEALQPRLDAQSARSHKS